MRGEVGEIPASITATRAPREASAAADGAVGPTADDQYVKCSAVELRRCLLRVVHFDP